MAMDMQGFSRMLQLINDDPERAFTILGQSGFLPPDLAQTGGGGQALASATPTGQGIQTPRVTSEQGPGTQGPSRTPQDSFGRALGALQASQPPAPHYFPAVAPRVSPGITGQQEAVMQMLLQGTQPQNLPAIGRLALPTN